MARGKEKVHGMKKRSLVGVLIFGESGAIPDSRPWSKPCMLPAGAAALVHPCVGDGKMAIDLNW